MESRAFAIVCQENHLQTKAIGEVGTLSQDNHLQTKEICEVGFFFFCFSRKAPSNKSNK
jgi:hypothetical protein